MKRSNDWPNSQNIEQTKPCTTGRQRHRDNVPGDTPALYRKRSVFFPLLDHLASEIESRIITPKDRFLAQYLIPSKLHLLTPKKKINCGHAVCRRPARQKISGVQK